MQEQVFDAAAVLQDPDVQQRVSAAAASAANVPENAVLYHDLQPVDDADVSVEGARLVSKQLHPAWVAKRNLKPELRDLWRVEEQHVAALSTTLGQGHVHFCRKNVAHNMLQLA